MGAEWSTVAFGGLVVGLVVFGLFLTCRRLPTALATTIRKKGKKPVPVLDSDDPLYTEPGELSSLERREQRFALAMLGANDGLWDWNLDTDAVYVSPRAEEIINIPASELAETSWALTSYMHPQDLPEFRRRIVAHVKGESAWFEFEYRVEDPQGRARWVLQRGLALRDETGRARRMAGSLSDITTRKEAEQRLVQAKVQAEAAAQTKSDFLAHMSHELRTPLNAIIGFADMIRSEVQGPLDHPYYPEYVDNIHRSGLHLLALINDVLDTAKIEAGRFELDEEVVDLIEVVRDVTDLLMPRSKRQGVIVKEVFPTYLPGLRGDVRRIKQVLLNLVTNAVKFSKPGGEVRIRIFLDGPKGLIIRVSDQGVGMNPTDIPKVLEAFGQVHHQTAKDSEGTGLGLPLSKALVELHGGKLAIKSAPGRGTIVTVTLPPDRVIIA